MNMQSLKIPQAVSEIELTTIIRTSFITTGTIVMTAGDEHYLTEVEFPR
jgi:hypothetical protein